MSDVSAQDRDYLKILAIFHFVVAGVAFLFALFPLIHFVLGLAMITGAFNDSGGADQAQFMGWLFVLLSGAWIAFGVAYSVAVAIAGRALRARRHHTFCLVVAGVSCMFMPFGTALGVFTIIVLMRDSVRQAFESPAEETMPIT